MVVGGNFREVNPITKLACGCENRGDREIGGCNVLATDHVDVSVVLLIHFVDVVVVVVGVVVVVVCRSTSGPA